ncbi:MAG TPA: restriction endonuclease subunit S, partial [Methylomirabilota bacterium]|nr:restriction endonuclease subunit S [Methylomirabilota bacterium]
MVSQSQLKLSFNRTKVNPYFIYYYLRSPLGQKALLANTSQVGVPAIAQALTSIRNITVSLPKKDHQDEIVEFLLNIDKKILLNQCMNDTLEGIAQALFKSWFVDFDPVKAKAEGREPDGMDSAIADLFPSSFIESPLGLIPQGWEVKGLDEIATFLNGLALQKYPTLDPENYLPVIKISQLRSGNTEGADKASTDVPPDYIITDGDILFSWSGSLEVEIWCGGRGALNQHLFKVSSKDFPKWFYFLWTRQHLDNFQKIAEGKATTMGHIQRKHLSEAKVICPPVRVIQGVNEIMETLLEKSVQLKLENRIIANLRDLLLPRLISGELPVGEIS